MTFLQAVILGLVQGITEFFPVSSSAHLKLAKWLIGVVDGEHLVYFDLVCHTGTLLALLIYLRKDVWEILCDWKKMALYFVALIPLVPAYFFMKPIRVLASEPQYLGYALMITAGLLFAASRKKSEAATVKWRHVAWVGAMQTLALVPGISRSGSTICAGRFCGWSWKEAAKFSFLLAIPTILGGELLETFKDHGSCGITRGCYAGGFLASFALGLVGVRFVFWVYEKEKVKPFAWYCLAAGLFAWFVFNG
jgi:undecaprenyl-diphosphatase